MATYDFNTEQALTVAATVIKDVLDEHVTPSVHYSGEREATAAWADNEEVEAFVKATGAKVLNDSKWDAHYIPRTDTIHMPPKGCYPTAEAYYGTLLHELTHWTGHETRTGRLQGVTPKSPEGCVEEMTAEFGSTLLCDHFGIKDDRGHAGYINNWLSPFRMAYDADRENLGTVLAVAATMAHAAVCGLFGFVRVNAPARQPELMEA